MSSQSKLRIANSIGLVDSQYKGVIGVIVENIEPPIKDIGY
jgi:dUTPase